MHKMENAKTHMMRTLDTSCCIICSKSTYIMPWPVCAQDIQQFSKSCTIFRQSSLCTRHPTIRQLMHRTCLIMLVHKYSTVCWAVHNIKEYSVTHLGKKNLSLVVLALKFYLRFQVHLNCISVWKSYFPLQTFLYFLHSVENFFLL